MTVQTATIADPVCTLRKQTSVSRDISHYPCVSVYLDTGEEFYRYAKIFSSKDAALKIAKVSNIAASDATVAKFNYLKSELIEDEIWNADLEYAQNTAIFFTNKFHEKLGIPSISMTDDLGYYIKWSRSSRCVIGVIYHNYISAAYLDENNNPIIPEVSGDRIEKIRFLNNFLESLSNDYRS